MPTLIVGGEPLSIKIIERMNRRYLTPYYWDIYGMNKANLEDYEAKITKIKPQEINGDEEFISKPSKIIFTIPLEEDYGRFNETLEAVSKILKYASNRKIKLTIGIYQQNRGMEKAIKELCKVLEEYGNRNGVIMYLGEVYGENMNLGLIFKILEILKEDCMNIQLPLNPEERRNYTYIDDAVRALINANEREEELNIYSVKGANVNTKTIIKRITELLGIYEVCEIQFNGAIEAISPPNFTQPEWFKPKINLIDGLNRTIGWFESEYGPIYVLPNNNRK
ncbi:MAG: hypothetical protein QXX09_00310 [Candidatus Methanomethylicia archaeon]